MEDQEDPMCVDAVHAVDAVDADVAIPMALAVSAVDARLTLGSIVASSKNRNAASTKNEHEKLIQSKSQESINTAHAIAMTAVVYLVEFNKSLHNKGTFDERGQVTPAAKKLWQSQLEAALQKVLSFNLCDVDSVTAHIAGKYSDATQLRMSMLDIREMALTREYCKLSSFCFACDCVIVVYFVRSHTNEAAKRSVEEKGAVREGAGFACEPFRSGSALHLGKQNADRCLR